MRTVVYSFAYVSLCRHYSFFIRVLALMSLLHFDRISIK